MKKKILIILGVIVVIAVGVGYCFMQNQNSPSVGIDSNIVDEDQKEGTTTLDSDRVLVVYFSNGGNTQKLAKEVFDQLEESNQLMLILKGMNYMIILKQSKIMMKDPSLKI